MNATATIAPAGPQTVTPDEPQPAAGGEATVGASGPQHMRALERANQVRLARAELKRRVAAGETSVAAVIVKCPWEAASMAIGDLLMSQRRWGRTRCHKFLAQIPISEQKTIGSMTERQRRTLAALLAPGASAALPAPSPWLAGPRLAPRAFGGRVGA
jgi:hypothetical protein